MATHQDGPAETGIEFTEEADGSITARDLETGLQRGGATRAAALQNLAEVLALDAGEGEPIDDEDAFLRELGLDPEEIKTAREERDGLPEFMQ